MALQLVAHLARDGGRASWLLLLLPFFLVLVVLIVITAHLVDGLGRLENQISASI